MSERRVTMGRLGAEMRRVARQIVPALGVALERAVTLQTFRHVLEGNPRETGKYQASHRVSVDPPVFAQLRGDGPFPTPGEADAAQTLARLDRPTVPTHITNDAGATGGERGYADLVEARHHVYRSALARLATEAASILTRELRNITRRFR